MMGEGASVALLMIVRACQTERRVNHPLQTVSPGAQASTLPTAPMIAPSPRMRLTGRLQLRHPHVQVRQGELPADFYPFRCCSSARQRHGFALGDLECAVAVLVLAGAPAGNAMAYGYGSYRLGAPLTA